jgi:hypothetical protein
LRRRPRPKLGCGAKERRRRRRRRRRNEELTGHRRKLHNKIKVKVEMSLCLIKHYVMKACGGVEVYLQTLLTSAVRVTPR